MKAALTDIDRVKLLYGVTRQQSTFSILKGTASAERTTAETKLVMYRELMATVTDTKAKKRVAKAVERKERQVEYLRLVEEEEKKDSGVRRIVWTGEPAVYALTPGGLVGIGYNNGDELLSLCSGFSQASLVGKSFADLGFREPVQLFHRVYGPNDMRVEGIFMADVNNPGIGQQTLASVTEASVTEASAPEASVTEASAPEASAPEASGPEASAPEASGPEASAPEPSAPAQLPETPVDPTTLINTIQLYDSLKEDIITQQLLEGDEPLRDDLKGQLLTYEDSINQLRLQADPSTATDIAISTADAIMINLNSIRETFNAMRDRFTGNIDPNAQLVADVRARKEDMKREFDQVRVEIDTLWNDASSWPQPLTAESTLENEGNPKTVGDLLGEYKFLNAQSTQDEGAGTMAFNNAYNSILSDDQTVALEAAHTMQEKLDGIKRVRDEFITMLNEFKKLRGMPEPNKTGSDIDTGFIDAMRDKATGIMGGQSKYEQIYNELINYDVEHVLNGKWPDTVKYIDGNEITIGESIGQFFNIGQDTLPQFGIDEFNRVKGILNTGNYTLEAQQAAERYNAMETKLTDLQDWIKGIVNEYRGGGQSMSSYGEPATASEFTPTFDPASGTA